MHDESGKRSNTLHSTREDARFDLVQDRDLDGATEHPMNALLRDGISIALKVASPKCAVVEDRHRHERPVREHEKVAHEFDEAAWIARVLGLVQEHDHSEHEDR